MEKYVKFRIIGCGHIGKRHAIVIGAANTAGLVSLCNIEVEKDDDLVGL